MKQTRIESFDVLEWKAESRQLYASEWRGDRRVVLYAYLNGRYVVEVNGYIKEDTMDVDTAVEAYNTL